MAHTAGPWSFTADMYGLHNMRVFGAADARGNGIANCGYDERGECEANARLIAAAPDLLAALTEAEDALTDSDTYPLTLKRVRDAIAKARGA